jgi:hypothetical protein
MTELEERTQVTAHRRIGELELAGDLLRRRASVGDRGHDPLTLHSRFDGLGTVDRDKRSVLLVELEVELVRRRAEAGDGA